ncbi:hypothetical protein L9F63_010546 [Diploptera punctata]|uniref:Uncharacterized protein n=1 Tax=Diploptera punctata TaxID=6984 RepID=A0AAD8AIR7_DIPPU|nr:hypothetical protein L9F63_010546 [Diploptera punctata]
MSLPTCLQVYMKDQSKILKTVKRNELTWIVFSVNHTVTLPQDLENVFSYTANFCISDSKKRLGGRAKADNPKVFYRAFPIKDGVPDEIIFEELYSSDEEAQTASSVITIEEMKEGEILKTETEQENKLFALPLNQHEISVRRLIYKFKIEDQSEVVEWKPKVEEREVKGKIKKGKGNSTKALKNSAKNVARGFSFTIDVKNFFSGNAKVTGEVKPLAPGLTYASVLIAVKELMSDEQAEKYNPLAIRISKLCNLPTEVLLEHRISTVYIRYKILDLKFETYEYPVQRNIMFENTKVIMINHFSPIKFIEFLQTGLLTVELIGIVEPQKYKILPSAFGQEIYDSDFSTQYKSTSPEVHCMNMLKESPNIVLATATYTLTNLILGHTSLDLCVNLKATNRNSLQNYNDGSDIFNMDELLNPETETPFTNCMLIENDTCLNASFNIMLPLKPLLRKVLSQKDVLNRIFMVLYDQEKAKEIVSNIYELNQIVLGPTTVAPDFGKTRANAYTASLSQATMNFLELSANRETSEYVRTMVEDNLSRETSPLSLKPEMFNEKDLNKDDIPIYMRNTLTGFIIDSFDKIIIFIEGLANGPLQHVWNNVISMPTEMGKVLYNSDLVFDSRLYSEFLPYGGLHIITLRIPLDIYLVNPKTFVPGYIPQLCWKALLNLDLLLKTTSISRACRQQLFPTTEDLLSFDIELGVPLHLQDSDRDLTNIIPRSDNDDSED